LTQLLKGLGDHQISQRVIVAANDDIKTLPDPEARDERYVWLSDQLKGVNKTEQALRQLDKVTRPALRKFKTYEIVGQGQSKWKEAVDLLIQVEQTNDRTYAPKAREARASVYKNQMGEYAQAISLFYEIDDPPRTLWEIQDCYWKWGKADEACNTLKEIETIFPKESSKAAFKRAAYYDQKGDKDKVIAECRRILKIYPKSRESSQSHQMLEKYGIATGGGVDE
jgi:tetratricopeptide (TPR) repeat protein